MHERGEVSRLGIRIRCIIESRYAVNQARFFFFVLIITISIPGSGYDTSST